MTSSLLYPAETNDIHTAQACACTSPIWLYTRRMTVATDVTFIDAGPKWTAFIHKRMLSQYIHTHYVYHWRHLTRDWLPLAKQIQHKATYMYWALCVAQKYTLTYIYMHTHSHTHTDPYRHMHKCKKCEQVTEL